MSTDNFERLAQSERESSAWAVRGWMSTGLGVLGGLWSTVFSGGGDADILSSMFGGLILTASLPLLWFGLVISAVSHHSALTAAVALQETDEHHTVGYHRLWGRVALGGAGLVSLGFLGVIVLSEL